MCRHVIVPFSISRWVPQALHPLGFCLVSSFTLEVLGCRGDGGDGGGVGGGGGAGCAAAASLLL